MIFFSNSDRRKHVVALKKVIKMQQQNPMTDNGVSVFSWNWPSKIQNVHQILCVFFIHFAMECQKMCHEIAKRKQRKVSKESLFLKRACTSSMSVCEMYKTKPVRMLVNTHHCRLAVIWQKVLCCKIMLYKVSLLWKRRFYSPLKSFCISFLEKSYGTSQEFHFYYSWHLISHSPTGDIWRNAIIMHWHCNVFESPSFYYENL